jgi:hypothetical protein
MILDEYVTSTGRAHNGTIRYDWHINPTRLFFGPNEVANVQVTFDLGIYQTASAAFTLQSVASSNKLPTITLTSPYNGSLFASGQVVDIDITDDGTFSASATLDGASVTPFASPWQISTIAWSDGHHTLEVVATDNEGGVSRASFSFETDALSPYVDITSPSNNSRIPINRMLNTTVSDARLASVTRKIDGGTVAPFNSPYQIDMTGWTAGMHTVIVTAYDTVGHTGSDSVTFEITTGTLVLQLLYPTSNSCVNSGTVISFSAVGNGTMSYRWSEGGIWHDIGSLTTISTSGWAQGVHSITINVTSDLGGWDQMVLVLTIDDIKPVVQLLSPDNCTFVTNSSIVTIHIDESHMAWVSYTIWSLTYNVTQTDLAIPLTSRPSDGAFTITLRAVDEAGNVGTDQFRFFMDSSSPTVKVTNLASGAAAKPGFVINVTATDIYLSSVICSLDSGTSYGLTYPFKVNTSSLANGWHMLKVEAFDSSGKNTSYEMRFYIDGSAPSVTMDSAQTFTSGEVFEVRVNVTDEFSVASVTLMYELQDGTFASMAMGIEGSDYVAEIPSSAMRDGMALYVVASDSVGNTVESNHVVLRESAVAPGTPDDEGGSGQWMLLGFPGIPMVVITAMIILSVGFMAFSTRRSSRKSARARPSSAVALAMAVNTVRPAVTKKEPLLAKMPEIERPVVVRPLVSTAPVADLAPPTLMDSIPTVKLRSPEPNDENEPEIDYGRLIEDELIIPSMKNSVYRDNLKDLNADIMQKLDELSKLCDERPKKTLGRL